MLFQDFEKSFRSGKPDILFPFIPFLPVHVSSLIKLTHADSHTVNIVHSPLNQACTIFFDLNDT
jgi:hypothetical protein